MDDQITTSPQNTALAAMIQELRSGARLEGGVLGPFIGPAKPTIDRAIASPQNAALAAVARSLQAAKDFGNRAQIPLLDMGAGDLLLGRAPEEVREWSYGNAPMQVAGGGTGSLIPQLKPGRAEGLADTAFLGADIAGLGAIGRAGAGALGRVAARQIPTAPSESRRGFLRTVGGLGAAAAAGAVPTPVRRVLTEGTAPLTRAAAEEVAPMAARRAAVPLWSSISRLMADNADFLTRDVVDVAGSIAEPLSVARHGTADDLLEMGFSPEQAEELLRVANGMPEEQFGAMLDAIQGARPAGMADDDWARLLDEVGGWYELEPEIWE